MQISRRILLACVTATALLPLEALPGHDNEAQIKARQALEQQMNQLPPPPAASAQPPATPATPPPPSVQPPVAAPPPDTAAAPASEQTKALQDALHQKMNESPAQPAPQPAAPASATPAPQPPPVKAVAEVVWPEVPEGSSPAHDQALQDALRQKMNELRPVPPPAEAPKPRKPVPAPPAPAVSPARMPPPAPPAVATAPAPAMESPQIAPPPAPTMPTPQSMPAGDESKWENAVMPPGASPDQLEKAQQALQEKISTIEGKPNMPETVNQAPTRGGKSMAEPANPRSQSAKKTKVVKSILPPLPAPAPAVSASKEQRLQELLVEYMADKISPEQYHEQRAKILAEP